MTREQLFAAFFFAMFLYLLFQLYRVFSLFLVPLIWAIILALTFYPLYGRFLVLFRQRRTLTSFLLTIVVTLTVIIPVLFFSGILAGEVADFYQRISVMIHTGELQKLWETWKDSYLGTVWNPWKPRMKALDINVASLALTAANAVSNFIVTQVTGVARNLLRFLFNFLIMVFSLFFFFRDGETLYRTLRDLIPMEATHKDAIFGKLYATLSAVIQGMFATAATQGLLAGVGLWLLGVPFAVFLGFAAAFLALLPLGGAALIWFPCVVYLGLSGFWLKALGLFLYGTLVVSTVDNFLKPLIIGGRTRLPTLFLFFGILGGLKAYGFLGIFLGPVLLATIVTFVDIYKEQYASSP